MSTPDEMLPGGVSTRRSVVLIGLNNDFGQLLESHFREHGWLVDRADNGPNGRSLVHERRSRMVVLQPDLPCESGWLTGAKLRLVKPPPVVIFVVDEADQRARLLAHFLGARVQFREDDTFGGLPLLLPRPQLALP